MLLVDTADRHAIARWARFPGVSGFTTNPMLMARSAGVETLSARDYLAAGVELCGIAKYLDIKGCEVVSGTGELGSLRNIIVATSPAPIVENIVSRSKYSYTYAQPFTPIFYHGTMSVVALTTTTSRLEYTLIWNQTAVGDAAAQAASRASRQQRFQAAVDNMAAAANAP